MPDQQQPKKLSPVEDLVNTLGSEKIVSEFGKVLPKHVPVERFIRIAQTAVRIKPDLAAANRQSFFSELMKAAQDGLVIDGREATINAYNNKKINAKIAKYMPMVFGICKKARNSGEIKTIDAAVVYEKDTYSQWTDETGAHFKHERARGERGKPQLTYAYAMTRDGGFFFEEIDEEQMNAIEASNRGAGEDSPWKGKFRDEMRRKSAIRRLAKYRLPSSTDIDQVIQRDDDLYDGTANGGETAPVEENNKPTRLGKMLGSEEKAAVAAAEEAETESVPEEQAEEESSAEVPI